MEITFDHLLNAGPIPILAIIAWLLWRSDKTLTIFQQDNLKIADHLKVLHSDVKAVIDRMAGIARDKDRE